MERANTRIAVSERRAEMFGIWQGGLHKYSSRLFGKRPTAFLDFIFFPRAEHVAKQVEFLDVSLAHGQYLFAYNLNEAANGIGIHRIARNRKDRKSTRLNSSHANISYAVFCL